MDMDEDDLMMDMNAQTPLALALGKLTKMNDLEDLEDMSCDFDFMPAKKKSDWPEKFAGLFMK